MKFKPKKPIRTFKRQGLTSAYLPVIHEDEVDDDFGQARLKAPADMPDDEKKEFKRIVSSMPSEWFGEEHIFPLTQYAHHVVEATKLRERLREFDGNPPKSRDGARRYRGMVNAEKQHSRAVVTLMRTMRLTQSSFSKGRGTRAGRPTSTNHYPWDWNEEKRGPFATSKNIIEWIEKHCSRIPEGKFVGKPLLLTKHQKKWIKRIFDTPTRTFILSMGRKNAKTAFCAILLILFLCSPLAKRNSHLYSTAQSKEQAAILFSFGAKIIRMSGSLNPVFNIKSNSKILFVPQLGTMYRALSADVPTSYGLSPLLTVHDELGQVKGPSSELYDALETASAAHEHPLTLVISTQAATDGSLLSMLIDDALTGANPRIKVELYTADKELDPFSLEAIKAANPHFDDFMNKEEVLSQMETARRLPSKESSYRNLILNQRVEARAPFISESLWKENGGKPAAWEKKKVWGGLDLASVSDLCALVLLTEDDDVHPTFWLPDEGLDEKSRSDRVPYNRWKEMGYLLTTPGKAVEYEFIAEYLRGVFDKCDVQGIAFDRYNMKFLMPWLKVAGFSDKELTKFVEFGQGFISMSPAIRQMETKLTSAKYKHGNHPVLTMCMQNVSVVEDAAQNKKFVKKTGGGRIDGAVAMVMAEGSKPIAPLQPAKKKYQIHFI